MYKNRASFNENKLLGILPVKEINRFARLLKPVPIKNGQVLFDRGHMSHVYFPCSGVITKIVETGRRSGVEAGMVGNEGMLPLCLVMELEATPFRAVVQNDGRAWQIESALFKSQVRPGSMLHRLLLRFAGAFMAQVSYSAGCNRMHPLEKRYCRWLLMTQDRLQTNQITVKQEFAGRLLGVRRMSITPVAQKLQSAGLIRYSRGVITILDRRRLEAATCQCYRRVQAVYDELLNHDAAPGN